ncbi:adenylate kinase 5, chloroplastic-like isoform X2 [Euphorbia lathyris]|uniref:adenylate kinase 5, chloroplastic-like isoform X2 n=1 Tax=Euphorbia lathyris TaxID=212925 RepID=UPI0033138E5A
MMLKDKGLRGGVEIAIPELNPEMDVYRIGTLMELVRVIALSFADDGKHVKVCVQGSIRQGALARMPLQLSGTRKIFGICGLGRLWSSWNLYPNRFYRIWTLDDLV